ncbi:MAG: flagellar biosynthetic protein FliO [Puniceicoccales bacterium]|jgi:hypothetical protein|nr:flagellar biosynthetic protein FliO [Puniceicoccales bacterium]
MVSIGKILFMGEALAAPGQISVFEMVVRTAIFLSLLALGGYFFVLFHRRGYFSCKKSSERESDEIKVISIRILTGKKLLTSVEHFGKRFLLAITNDRVEKLAEWEIQKEE